MTRARFFVLLVLVLVAVGCGSSDDVEDADTPTSSADLLFPDVLAAEAHYEGEGSWRFEVTISSPYDSPAQYADAWRVVSPDGDELGIRVLLHDHAGEQPFTRSQSGIVIPTDVNEVTIEGRDLVNGWGGTTLQYALPDLER